MDNFYGLDKSELLKLKANIDIQLECIDRTERLKNRNCLSEMKNNNDEIYCIHFSGSKILNHDFVKLNISEDRQSYEWVNFSASDPMGCSSSFHKDYLRKHYFLSIFVGSMYFFTLKPESWKEDLKSAFDFQMVLKKGFFEKEVAILESQVLDVLSVDDSEIIIPSITYLLKD